MDNSNVSIEIESNSDYGDVVFFDAIFKKLGIEESIDKHSEKRNQGFRVGKVSRLIVSSYLSNLGKGISKFSIPEWYETQDTLQKQLKLEPEEIGEQDLYRSLEYLTEDVQHKVINDYVTTLVTEYGISMDTLFEDVTSTYFTGENCLIAMNGYSRDHRPDLEQVNIEIAVTKDDHFPVKHSTYEGNIPDKKKGDRVPKELRTQYPNLSSTLVVDKGMSEISNRRSIIENGFDYVAALEINSETKKLVLSVNEKEFKEKDLKAEGLKVAVKEGKFDEKAILDYIYYNLDKAAQDRRSREKKIKKAKEEIKKLQEKVNKGTFKKALTIKKKAIKILKTHKVNLYFDTTVERVKGITPLQIILEEKRDVFIEKERLDGKFVLQTTCLDKSPKDILKTYRQKDGVEKAFDVLKNLIKIRPIRHWNEERVKGHIFLCILAYLVISVAKYVVKKAKIDRGIEKIYQKLHQVRRVVVKVTVGRETYLKESITGLDNLSRKLLSLVETTLPP